MNGALSLTDDIDDAITTLGVAGTVPADVVPVYRFAIDDEVMLLEAFGGWAHQDRNEWHIQRGYEGSTAAAHTAGAECLGVSDAWVAGTTIAPPGPLTGGGDGGAGTLEATLAAGNTTGEHTVVLPMGIIDGTADTDELDVFALSGDAGASGKAVAIRGGGSDGVDFDHALVQVNGNFGNGRGGTTQIQSASSNPASGQPGGDIQFTRGTGDGAGRDGQIFLGIPTSDPEVAGALWNNLGVVTVSEGPP